MLEVLTRVIIAVTSSKSINEGEEYGKYKGVFFGRNIFISERIAGICNLYERI